MQGLAASLLVEEAAAVRAALYVEMNIVLYLAGRGGAVATATLCAGSVGNAGAAVRAVEREGLSFLARVALRGGASAMTEVCVGALVQAAAAMHVAAHAALNIVARVKVPVLTVARGPAGPRKIVCGY